MTATKENAVLEEWRETQDPVIQGHEDDSAQGDYLGHEDDLDHMGYRDHLGQLGWGGNRGDRGEKGEYRDRGFRGEEREKGDIQDLKKQIVSF